MYTVEWIGNGGSTYSIGTANTKADALKVRSEAIRQWRGGKRIMTQGHYGVRGGVAEHVLTGQGKCTAWLNADDEYQLIDSNSQRKRGVIRIRKS